jgi:hypothetical protein
MRGDRAIFGVRACAAVAIAAVLVPTGSGVPQEPAGTPLYIAVAGVGGSMSTLTIAYPADPGAEQAQKDVAELAAAGQWSISPPQRAESADGVLYESQITPAVTLDAAGQVPVFPFLAAFRRFPRVTFGFVGEAAGAPGEYHDENRYVAAEWNRAGQSVKFDFRIKDQGFRTAEDVRLVDRPADQPLPMSTVAPRRPNATALWVLLLVGSLGTGVFVWGLTWWLLTRGEAPSEPTEKGKSDLEAKDTLPETVAADEGPVEV